jgi:heme oxygenase
VEILTALRAATGPAHARIEQLPICADMLNGPLDREEYVRLLTDLYHISDAVEEGLAALPGWPACPSRAAAAARDLAVLGGRTGDRPEWVAEWIDAVRRVGHPAAWAGVGYVMEGSRMGSRVLAKTVARGLGLLVQTCSGLDYHLDAGADPAGTWKAVLVALADHGRDATAGSAMVAAAIATFELLYSRHEAISLKSALA